MKNRKIIILIFVVSVVLSISLGMLDHETESLVHLLTSDGGNIIALIFYSFLFAALGFLVWGMILLISHFIKSVKG